MAKQFNSFSEFYPFYLSEHNHRVCRRLHFVGTWTVVGFLCLAAAYGNWLFIIIAPVSGYAFAWTGHFFFEKNKPATITYPLYSLAGDWVMFKDILSGRIKL